jgi:hypothetical protein
MNDEQLAAGGVSWLANVVYKRALFRFNSA